MPISKIHEFEARNYIDARREATRAVEVPSGLTSSVHNLLVHQSEVKVPLRLSLLDLLAPLKDLSRDSRLSGINEPSYSAAAIQRAEGDTAHLLQFQNRRVHSYRIEKGRTGLYISEAAIYSKRAAKDEYITFGPGNLIQSVVRVTSQDTQHPILSSGSSDIDVDLINTHLDIATRHG